MRQQTVTTTVLFIFEGNVFEMMWRRYFSPKTILKCFRCAKAGAHAVGGEVVKYP